MWSAWATVCRVNIWFRDDFLCSLSVIFLIQNPIYHAKLTTYIAYNDSQASPRPFLRPTLYPAQGDGKGSRHHHHLSEVSGAYVWSHRQCKQWTPGRLLGLIKLAIRTATEYFEKHMQSSVIVIHVFGSCHLEIGYEKVVQTKIFSVNIRFC